jgi:hypothetical protein
MIIAVILCARAAPFFHLRTRGTEGTIPMRKNHTGTIVIPTFVVSVEILIAVLHGAQRAEPLA